MSDQKIIVDLSCGGWQQDGKVVSWLSSNVAHMYDHKKELLAKAPGFTGYPHGHFYGSAFIEGTADELEKFFAEFIKEYDEDLTLAEVEKILELVRQGQPLIRCYRIIWPGRYEPEREDSEMFARMAQVITHEDRGAGWGHLGAACDDLRLRSLWEVTNVILLDTCYHVHFRNGFSMALSYHEIGFDFNEDEEAPQQKKPEGADYDRFIECVKKVADRYDEKIEWFAEMMKADPRYKVG